MKATIRLGRIAGVPVGLHWSVFGIAALLLVGLAAELPRAFPGRWPGWYLLAAVLAIGLFVLSLLAHELSHAVVARRNGVKVEGITLWLLGGVARFGGEALTPGAEFRIAVVGPAVSAVTAAGFFLLSWLTEAGELFMLGAGVFGYLAWINLLLAAFNLIPAAPLDGGRVLRAAVWRWRGDRLIATVWAARAGRGFGFLLIGFGLFRALSGTGFGLWWVLLGLFVATMAGAEEHQARTGAALEGMRVQDVMTANPETAPADITVADFVRDVVMTRRHSAFPLLDSHGGLQGLVTLNRLRSVPVERREDSILREIACPPNQIPLVRPDEPLSTLLPLMNGCADGRALVLADDRLVGIVSPSDISRAVAIHALHYSPRPGQP
ncbi:site-2 protease family protein [Kibdelosporangium aridum]|uniref:Zinc metalloprotease n=1 Tax=Kibdelosporangium aridum TaxID=2030 RepID=A0A428ZB28_KIBAR|nr:site-2 protease family protein [Kibdelosporangium aridum]RSM85265.1 site-2 protease family protein [Kibdelosporangium aridum]